MTALVRSHVHALQRNECLRHARIVLVPENNLDQTQHVCQYTVDLAGVSVLCADSNKYGVPTKPGMRKMYVGHLNTKLGQRAVRLHHTLVCASPFEQHLPHAQRLARRLGEFRLQLLAFECVVKAPRSLNQQVQVAYTGKASVERQFTSRRRDDMVLALLVGLYYALIHVSPLNKLYETTHRIRHVDGQEARMLAAGQGPFHAGAADDTARMPPPSAAVLGTWDMNHRLTEHVNSGGGGGGGGGRRGRRRERDVLGEFRDEAARAHEKRQRV